MLWVTRSHVHVDRVACPWLITRFIDSEAEFIFVPVSRIPIVVEQEGAIAFDAPGVELGHHGPDCSFDSIIKKYELKDKALLYMAEIINAADTDHLDKNPIAAGLEALATGYSLRFPDDYKNLQQQFPIYDSLYTWCRFQVAKGTPK
jgi:hypothetical protein